MLDFATLLVGGLLGAIVTGPICAAAHGREKREPVVADDAQELDRVKDDFAKLRRERDDLRFVCYGMRQMLEGHQNRCEDCMYSCPFEGTDMCILDEHLSQLGVDVPEPREVGHVSQCDEEDAHEG